MAYETYTVQRGDNLSKIAKQLGLGSWRELYNLNKGLIRDPNLIYSGWKLKIPGTDKPAPTPQPQTQQQQAPAPQPEPETLAQQYTNPLTGQLEEAAEIPQYENVMPFLDSWNRLAPHAKGAALSQIQPEVQRELKANSYDYMNQLTSAGGQRFGRGMGGLGNLKAAAGRSQNAQVQDWMNAYQQGYTNLFYNPSRDAWNKARTQAGFDSSQYTMPTWDEFANEYNTAYGV